MPRIELFISKTCLSYQPAMELLSGVKEAFPECEFEVVDCREERKRARAAGVVMDPAFLLDGEVVMVGLPEKDLLIEKVGSLLKK